MADDGDTLGLGATGCRMHAFVADPKCSVCWDLKPQWKDTGIPSPFLAEIQRGFRWISDGSGIDVACFEI